MEREKGRGGGKRICLKRASGKNDGKGPEDGANSMANPRVLEEENMKPQNSSRGDFQEIAPSVHSVHKTDTDHRWRSSSFQEIMLIQTKKRSMVDC